MTIQTSRPIGPLCAVALAVLVAGGGCGGGGYPGTPQTTGPGPSSGANDVAGPLGIGRVRALAATFPMTGVGSSTPPQPSTASPSAANAKQLVAAMEDCAPPSHGEGLVEVTLSGSGKMTVSSAIENEFEPCVMVRLKQYPLDPGRYVVLFSWQREPGLPRLAYPLPKASSKASINVVAMPIESLQIAAESLTKRLEKAGYTHTYWFSVLDGFAVVTAPEKIEKNGELRFKDEERRFSRDFEGAPDGLWDGLSYRLRRIFWTDGTRYRTFILVCASGEVEDIEPKPLEKFLPVESGETATGVPDGIPTAAPDRRYKLRAFAYVFERAEARTDAKLLTTGISAAEHLKAAGLTTSSPAGDP